MAEENQNELVSVGESMTNALCVFTPEMFFVSRHESRPDSANIWGEHMANDSRIKG